MLNSKHEYRNSKQERKFKYSKFKTIQKFWPLKNIKIYDFVSDFVLRISNFNNFILVFLVVFFAFSTGCAKEKPDTKHEGHKTVESNAMEQKEAMPADMVMPEQPDVKQPSVEGYVPIQLQPERVQKMGITTAKISSRKFTRTVRTTGIVEIDETRLTHVHTKSNGWIEELYVDFIGKPVKKGQPLFSIYSPELLTTQEEYLLALKDSERSVKGPFASEAGQASKDLLVAARRRLELWDMPAEDIDALEKTRTPKRAVVINSPRDGVVIRKDILKGMNVNPDMHLYAIADLSNIWVKADIYENDISFVAVGQNANLSIAALPEKILKGVVKFIDPVLDEATRTVKVRFEFDNKEELLKPGMYATIELEIDKGSGLAVPEEAVIDTGKRKIVFISKGKGRFDPREVKLKEKADNFYPVVSGLSENELVATSAQFLLDSESSLKAAGEGGMKH